MECNTRKNIMKNTIMERKEILQNLQLPGQRNYCRASWSLISMISSKTRSIRFEKRRNEMSKENSKLQSSERKRNYNNKKPGQKNI